MNIEEMMEKFDIEPKKYRDQIFLKDGVFVEKLINYAELDEKDKVLEIGSGLGNITQLIDDKCSVIAIENDTNLVKVLESLELKRTKIINEDALEINYEQINFNKVIANPPFSISSQLLIELIDKDWKLAVLIFQKELAEKMVVEPGNSEMTHFSFIINYYCDTELKEVIPKTSFTPAPETDSAIVKLAKKNVDQKSELFWKVVKSVYQHKNKKLKNALINSRHLFNYDKTDIRNLESKIPDKRVYECLNEDFDKLTSLLNEIL